MLFGGFGVVPELWERLQSGGEKNEPFWMLIESTGFNSTSQRTQNPEPVFKNLKNEGQNHFYAN